MPQSFGLVKVFIAFTKGYRFLALVLCYGRSQGGCLTPNNFERRNFRIGGENGFITEFNGTPERLNCRRRMQLLTACHHHRRPWQPQKAFNQSRNGIQYP